MDFNRMLSKLAPADVSEVWIDFDGTLTNCDVLDALVRNYCETDEWRALEDAWQAGKIGSRVCLAGQFGLVQITPEELDSFLATMTLDPGTPDLLALLAYHGVRATILSDGIDWFIDRILRSHRLTPPPVRSNTLVRAGKTWRLDCPHASASCESDSAHCKCGSMEQLETRGRRRIYVGDGRSDLCAARKADVRFAKGTLAARLGDEGLEYLPFTTLHDVCSALSAAWSKPKVRAA